MTTTNGIVTNPEQNRHNVNRALVGSYTLVLVTESGMFVKNWSKIVAVCSVMGVGSSMCIVRPLVFVKFLSFFPSFVYRSSFKSLVIIMFLNLLCCNIIHAVLKLSQSSATLTGGM